jgi:hypothetical protein
LLQGFLQAESVSANTTKYEAEDMNKSNVSVSSANSGYTGTGYVTGFTSEWSSIHFGRSLDSNSTIEVKIRYANASGSTINHLGLYLGNTKVKSLSLPTTASWSTWATLTETVSVGGGGWLDIKIKNDTNASLSPQIDYIEVTTGVTSPTPTPTATPTPTPTATPTPTPTATPTPPPPTPTPPPPTSSPPPPGTTTYEAENAALSGGAASSTGHSGYSGSGFVEGYHFNASANTVFTVNASSAGSRNVTLRYAAGNGSVSSLDLFVNGTKSKTLSLAGTGGWSSWGTHVESISLNNGVNTIGFKSNASSNAVANLDNIYLQPDPTPPPTPTPSPGAFNLTFPANNATGVSTKPNFTWDTSSAASSYTLVVSTSSSYANPILNITGLTGTSYQPTLSLAGSTTYYWKVTSQNTTGTKLATNAGISFTTGTAPTPTPTPTPPPGATQYYVSTTGSDTTGSGTQGNPWRTIAHAAAQVPADGGHTINIGAGTFTETQAIRLKTGTNLKGAGKSQTIITASGAIPSHEAGIDSSHADWKLMYHGSLIQLFSPGYSGPNNRYGSPENMIASANGNQTLRDFTLDGNSKAVKAGVWVENRNNVTIHDVNIRNFDQRGAVFARSDMWWYIALPEGKWMNNTTIYNVNFENNGAQLGSETLGNLNLAGLDGANIYNITVNDTVGYGIKFIFVGHFRNVKIYDSEITVNEQDAAWGEKISIELWNLSYGNEVYNINCNTWFSFVNHAAVNAAYLPSGTQANNLKIYNIRMVDQDGVSGKEAVEAALAGVQIYDSYFQDKGFGVAIWWGAGSYELKNYIIRNNIFANVNRTPGFGFGNSAAIFVPDTASNIKIYNNVFDRMGNALQLNSASGVDIRNNAFLQTEGSDVDGGSNITFTHNLKYHTNSQKNSFNIGGVTLGAGNVVGNPGFLGTGSRWDTYYKPASASSLVVDAGTNVGYPFSGSAPNIGRWE